MSLKNEIQAHIEELTYAQQQALLGLLSTLVKPKPKPGDIRVKDCTVNDNTMYYIHAVFGR